MDKCQVHKWLSFLRSAVCFTFAEKRYYGNNFDKSQCAERVARTRRRTTALRLFAHRQGVFSRRDKDARVASLQRLQGYRSPRQELFPAEARKGCVSNFRNATRRGDTLTRLARCDTGIACTPKKTPQPRKRGR